MRRPGCDDWRHTQHALERQGGRTVAIPREALDGLAEFERQGGLSRRNVLAGGVGLVLGVAGAGRLTTRGVLEAAVAEAADNPNGTILVSIYLDGGNDGLNTLVPLAEPRYRELRGRIGIAPETTLALPDAPQFGWHPSLGGLKELYDAGKVAVLPSIDYANPDQSHFTSNGYWRTGIVGASNERTGWLGRTLDAIGSRSNPLQGISVSYGLDPILNSAKAPVAAVYDPSNFDFWIPDVWDSKAFLPSYRRIAQTAAKHGALGDVRRVYGDAIEARDLLQPLAKEKEPPPPPIAYPEDGLGEPLRNLGRMLGAGFGTRIAALSSGGYDTHDGQPDAHAKLLQNLGDSLKAWQADLDARQLSDRVLTLVWSEFGRRPEDNDSQGTDHGAGGLLLLVGNRANGGIRSEFPGLGQLDDDENLRVTTDFRSVYATILEDWIGVEAARILPNGPRGKLPLVRAA